MEKEHEKEKTRKQANHLSAGEARVLGPKKQRNIVREGKIKGACTGVAQDKDKTGSLLELPILFNRLDGPLELLTEGLGEELLDGHVKLLAENNRETGINVVLENC